MPIRNPAEVQKMLFASPRYIAKRCACTVAQADAMQKYLLLVLMCDHAQLKGEPYDDLERQAVYWSRKIPPRLQDTLSRF